MDRDLEIADKKQRILNTFKYYTQGPSVPSDGNCGLHAICKALGDGLYMAGNYIKPNALMLKICYMFDLKNLPNYWWSDEELAVIANDYGYDMYIYNETDRTGIVFGKGIRPPLVLYSVNNNSHWIPGMRTAVPSSCIPKNFTIVENISEVLSIKQIKIKIKVHLLMRSLNSSGGCIESYSGTRDGNGNSSNERRNNRRHNRSRSGGPDEGQDGSYHERNNVSCNKRRDECHSGRRDGVRIIVKQDEHRPQLEKAKEVRRSNSAGEKKIHNGGKLGSHNAGEEKSHNRGKVGSHSGEEKCISEKSDKKLLVPYSPTVNGDHSYGMYAIKQEFNLYTKLKNTVLSKIVRQLYHWNWNKTNKYKKFDLFDSEDESDDSQDIELNTMYNARYTVMRDMLHYFISKNERKILTKEACDALMALQSLGPTMFQSGPINCSKFDPFEVECHMEDVNCCQIAAIEYYPKATANCCSIEPIDHCLNVAVDYQYKVPVFSTTFCLCYIEDCPFKLPQCILSDQWVSDIYINDLVDGHTLERKKIKGTRLFDRVYNPAVAMSNKVIERYIVKSKRVVDAPPSVASVLAPAVVASIMTASVVASPAMAAWTVVDPGLSSSVMKVTPAVAAPPMDALMTVVPDVATPTMALEVTPSGNDLMMVPMNNDLLATPMQNNLTMNSEGNDLMVKPNTSTQRYFSLNQIWKKKTKTQQSKDH